MNTKLISLLVTLAMFSGSLCYASAPTITRDYVTRKSGGVTRCEEKILVNYRDLQLEQGDYAIISFFDIEYDLLERCFIDLNVNSLYEDEVFIASGLLSGTEYIEIEFVGPKHNYDGTLLPLNIYK